VSTHHPTDATLAAYAAGTLPEGLAMVVATHLHFCPDCRRMDRVMEATGGNLLSDIAPAAMAPDALTRVLARTADAPPPERSAPILQSGLPPPLDRCAFGRWWPVAPGLRWRPMKVSGRAWAGLLVVAPGRSMPKHGHDGLELACVLRGSFVDASGRYGAGDIAEPEGDHDIPPRVDSDDPCVCVIASEGVRMRGVLGSIQRLLGR
jgi:putative transcriptional regulator